MYVKERLLIKWIIKYFPLMNLLTKICSCLLSDKTRMCMEVYIPFLTSRLFFKVYTLHIIGNNVYMYLLNSCEEHHTEDMCS